MGFRSFVRSVVSAPVKVVKKTANVVTDVVDTGVSVIKKVPDVVADIPKAVANVAQDTVKGTVSAAKDLATGTVDTIKDVAQVPVDLAKGVVKATKGAVGDVMEAIIPTPKIPDMPVVQEQATSAADVRSNQALIERDRADRLRRRRGRAATMLVQPSISAVPTGSVATKSLLGQ